MTPDPPTPPTELPADVVNALTDCTPDQLQQATRYAEELAEHKSQEQRTDQAVDEPVDDERSTDRPSGVPSKATITIKEINDNRYYYWQWRDGEKIRSQYKSPVDSDE